jgi:GT2 family glycosyltransferase
MGGDVTLASASLTFSVVILTYSRDLVLKETLNSLRDCIGGRSDLEVILVDNNADDVDRTAYLTGFPHSQWVRNERNTGVSARNDGMDVARGEIIVLLDDDVLVRTAGFLDIFEADFAAHADVAVINVRKLDGETLSVLPECIPHTRKDLDIDRPFYTFRFVGGLVGLRRSLHLALGGFSRELFYGEEEREYSYRIIKAGWKIYYEPRITAIETNNQGGRRSRSALRTEILANRYVISFLHRPAAVMVYDILVFTIYLFVLEKGRIDIGHAMGRFLAWLRTPGRPRRQPIGARERAYIRACGGTIWR